MIFYWDDEEEMSGTELNGGAGASLFFVVGWDDGEEVRGTKSHDDVISAPFNKTSLIGADADRFWSLSFWVFNSELKWFKILFIQGFGSNLINVIQQPSRWY